MNEISFQRKKEVPYSSQPSTDSTKNIYDYILKQDSKIHLLEKGLQTIKSDLSQLMRRDSTIEEGGGKIAKDDQTPFNHCKEGNKEIKEIISNIICTEDYISPFMLQLKNSFIDMQSTSEQRMISIEKKLSQLEERPNSNNNNAKNEKAMTSKECKVSNDNSIYIDLIAKNAKAQEALIDISKADLLSKIIIIQKRLNEFDQDFDRLIDSLKTQFQNVNEMITDKKSSTERDSLIMNASANKSLNPEIIENIFTTIIQLKEKNQRNEHIIESLSQVRKDPIEKDSITNMMANEVISLRKEISTDFELINNKILNELQSQANEISNLYSLLKTQNDSKHLGKSDNSNELGDIIAFLEQELEKKANIEQLNYALESQSKINDAFFLAYRVGRWSWSHGRLDDKGIIIWSLQNINTALDHFNWNSENGAIAIQTKGIYEVSTGLISTSNIAISIYINDTLVIKSNDSNSINNMILINQYIALGEGSKLKIGILIDSYRDSNSINAESFLEIRKVI